MYVYVCAYLNYSAVHWKLNNIVNQQSFKKKKNKSLQLSLKGHKSL